MFKIITVFLYSRPAQNKVRQARCTKYRPTLNKENKELMNYRDATDEI